MLFRSVVNEHYQTKESHIYAIGDVIGGLQLAHVASHEGMIAVEHMAGQDPKPLDETLVSKCVYSHPETASVGLTEQAAKEQGYEVKIGKFPFMAIGKALVFGESDGFVKIIADQKTDDILGIHMIGPHVTDMISEAGLALGGANHIGFFPRDSSIWRFVLIICSNARSLVSVRISG